MSSSTWPAPPEHAFATWTSRLGRWWPGDHTVSGAPSALVMEPRVGGRIVERGPDGTEHEWGSIRHWEPPRLLVHSWHLGRADDRSTEVQVRFVPVPAGTRVEIEHRGWDDLTSAGGWYERTATNWSVVHPHYIELAQEGSP